MSRFLRHVVEAALSGDDGALKETAIGLAVFDRPPDYNPKLDPVVRTEARRLRATLHRHYAEEGQHDYIRISIPTGGYRPVFDVLAAAAAEPMPAEILPSGPPLSPHTNPRPLLLTVVISGLLLLTAVTVLVARRVLARAKPLAAAPLVRLLRASVEREINPSFSPDGRRMAFAWDRDGNYDIFIRPADGDALPFQLTTNPAQDIRPAWSPDERFLAFLRTSGSGMLDVVIVPAKGGPERVVARVSCFSVKDWPYQDTPYGLLQTLGPGPAWTPDGSHVVVTGAVAGSSGSLPLQFVSVAQEGRKSQPRTVTHPPPGARDVYPAFSRDGAWMAFGRLRGHATYELYVMPAYGGDERRIAFGGGSVQGIAWEPDGRSIVVSSSVDGATYRLWNVNLDDGRAEPLPIRAQNAREPTISPDGSRIVFADMALASALWRVRTAVHGRPPSAPERLLESPAMSWAAAYSPDGTRLAFSSTLSGFQEVWTSDADGSRPRQLTHFEGAQVGWPRWSPDGRSLAFDARIGWRASLFMAQLEDGALMPLPLLPGSLGEMRPSWSGDGRWLFFCAERSSGSPEFWRRPFQREGKATLLMPGGAADIVGVPGSSTVYFTHGHDVGIWQIEQGSKASLVPGLEKVFHQGMWTVNKIGIWFVDHNVDRQVVWLYRFSTRRIERAANLGDGAPFVVPRLSVSPDGKWIVYSRYSTSESHLWAVDFGASHSQETSSAFTSSKDRPDMEKISARVTRP